MNELNDKIEVRLCGPFSQEARFKKNIFFSLFSHYENKNKAFSLEDFRSEQWQDMMHDLITNYGFENDTAVQFGMAKRLYDSGCPDKGWPYLKQAIKNINRDKNPAMMITDIITLMLKHNMPHFAVRLNEAAIQSNPEFDKDPIMHATLGNCYIHAGRANEGVAHLVKTLRNHPEFDKDPVMHNTLGNCYIHAGRANEGVAHLVKTLRNHPEFDKDPVMHNTLGNCYIHAGCANEGVSHLIKTLRNHPEFDKNPVMHSTLMIASVNAKMRKIFDRQRTYSTLEKPIIDYLDAKLAYFENNSRQARMILQPYVADTAKCPHSMLGLYLACVGDDHGIHAILPMFKSAYDYDWLLARRDEWMENPMRTELGMTDTYSSSWRIHEEGVNAAANRQARTSAGVYMPVGVKPL